MQNVDLFCVGLDVLKWSIVKLLTKLSPNCEGFHDLTDTSNGKWCMVLVLWIYGAGVFVNPYRLTLGVWNIWGEHENILAFVFSDEQWWTMNNDDNETCQVVENNSQNIL